MRIGIPIGAAGESLVSATAWMYAKECARADIVITTALVRGWAPTTITADIVATMKPGSVIVDPAAVGGGNCEATVPGQAAAGACLGRNEGGRGGEAAPNVPTAAELAGQERHHQQRLYAWFGVAAVLVGWRSRSPRPASWATSRWYPAFVSS